MIVAVELVVRITGVLLVLLPRADVVIGDAFAAANETVMTGGQLTI